ncbi:hypothetical protein [Pseudomonas xanthosomatis]|uniref:hypothetical protein n=1 Tax=Pseudomonas xanthosomatis TaxID=2842356 RepID=UPI0035182EE2
MPAYFPLLVINGQVHDLAHLEPFTFSVHSARCSRDLRVRVTFSNHCFTKGIHCTAEADGAEVVERGRRIRVFCAVRYQLSFRLRLAIEGIAAPTVRVYQTAAARNWCYSIRIDSPDGPYHVFFEVRRAGQEQRQWQELNLIVESAYPQGARPGPALKGHMPFVLLCSKVYLCLPASTRR